MKYLFIKLFQYFIELYKREAINIHIKHVKQDRWIRNEYVCYTKTNAIIIMN